MRLKHKLDKNWVALETNLRQVKTKDIRALHGQPSLDAQDYTLDVGEESTRDLGENPKEEEIFSPPVHSPPLAT